MRIPSPRSAATLTRTVRGRSRVDSAAVDVLYRAASRPFGGPSPRSHQGTVRVVPDRSSSPSAHRHRAREIVQATSATRGHLGALPERVRGSVHSFAPSWRRAATFRYSRLELLVGRTGRPQHSRAELLAGHIAQRGEERLWPVTLPLADQRSSEVECQALLRRILSPIAIVDSSRSIAGHLPRCWRPRSRRCASPSMIGRWGGPPRAGSGRRSPYGGCGLTCPAPAAWRAWWPAGC